jgi:hypothetical protein
MDIISPQSLTEMNQTATDRLNRYIENYDTGILNNWRFQANQRFTDEMQAYEDAKNSLIVPFEMAAALPEFNRLVAKGGRKIDETLDTINKIRQNPESLMEGLENKIPSDVVENFSSMKDKVQTGFKQAKEAIGEKIESLKNTKDIKSFKSLADSRRGGQLNEFGEDIELKPMGKPEPSKYQAAQRSSGFDEWYENGWSEGAGSSRGYQHQNSAQSNPELPEDVEEKNYQKELADAKTTDDQVKSIEKDNIEGVSGETPTIEETMGKTALAETAGETAAEGAEVGLVEGAATTAAEFLGPVGVAAALGYSLYNLFEHGLHEPHPTKLSDAPQPKIPAGLNINSTIRPHLNSVQDYSSGLTNF